MFRYMEGGWSFLSPTIAVEPLPCLPDFYITVRHNWGSFFPNTVLWFRSMVCHSLCLFYILQIVHLLWNFWCYIQTNWWRQVCLSFQRTTTCFHCILFLCLFRILDIVFITYAYPIPVICFSKTSFELCPSVPFTYFTYCPTNKIEILLMRLGILQSGLCMLVPPLGPNQHEWKVFNACVSHLQTPSPLLKTHIKSIGTLGQLQGAREEAVPNILVVHI